MPTINFSVTQSIDTLAVNLSASEALVMNINNPLVGASYFGLETIPDSNGVYTSSSPKNTLGSFTLGTGIIGLVKDDYKMSAVVSPGDNVLTFSPAVAVTGSTLRTRGISSPPVSGFDADALAFFNRVAAAGGTLSETEKIATNQLVLDLKANSLWTPMKAIYPMVGSSAAACAQNLKSSSFTGTFTSGWTFASTGVTPNGTSAYMNTNYAQVSEDTDNNHISIYSRTNFDGSVADMGVASGTKETNILSRLSNQFYFRMQGSNATTVSSPNSLGFFMANRILSTQVKGIKNSTINTISNTSNGIITSLNIYLCALNFNGAAAAFSPRQLAFSSIGQGLTDTQSSNLYTSVQTFQTTLSRNV
jgi:hypothetical protein